jgi:hypothetical protein
VLVWLALVACQAPGPAAPPDASRVALQDGDLPADLHRCPGSGDVDAYLRALQAGDRAAHDEVAGAWADLKGRGAVGAAVAVYAQRTTGCGTRVGAGDGATVTSLVVTFRDEDAAAGAYERGLLGFTTPADDQEVEDTTRGVATGLGRHSWVLQRSVRDRSMLVALWERDRVAVLVVAVDEDPLHAKQALTSVDGRMT